MSDYLLMLTCPSCGHDLEHIADGRPQSNGTALHVIAACSGCRTRWVLQARLALADALLGRNQYTGTERRETCEACGDRFLIEPGRKRRATCSRACFLQVMASRTTARHERERRADEEASAACG